MNISIIIPHYAVGKMTAYSIYKIIEHSKFHNIEIIVIDNKFSDGSYKYLLPFKDIILDHYPEELLQSHGIAINWALERGLVKNEYFICLENDAFPIDDNWLSFYENIIEQGYDAAGSILQLSGGRYLHPCGALYKKSLWKEADMHFKSLPYSYFPNMSMKNNFPCHLMVHDDILQDFLNDPNDWVELANGYNGLSKEEIIKKRDQYNPTNCVFHWGMGGGNENLTTYGFRNEETEVPNILIPNKKKIFNRMGYEPGQAFYYLMLSLNKKIFEIDTEIKWMNGRIGQQQEYTLMKSGVKHIWGVSSYTERSSSGFEDVFIEKNLIPEVLYNQIPNEFKI